MTIALRIINNRPLRWLVALMWTGIVAYLLLQPEGQSPVAAGVPFEDNTLEREIVFTTLHLIAFGTTCAVWFWAWVGHVSLTKSLLMAIIIAVAFGTVTEYLQAYAPNRSPSLFDFLANALGALMMGYLIWRKQSQILQYNQS